MIWFIKNRLFWVWFLLVIATLGSVGLIDFVVAYDYRYLGISALCIAFIKVRFIISEFMEVRTGPLWTRAVMDIWLVGLLVVLVALYWVQPQ